MHVPFQFGFTAVSLYLFCSALSNKQATVMFIFDQYRFPFVFQKKKKKKSTVVPQEHLRSKGLPGDSNAPFSQCYTPWPTSRTETHPWSSDRTSSSLRHVCFLPSTLGRGELSPQQTKHKLL